MCLFSESGHKVAMESYPSAKGRPDIKSMDIVSQDLVGFGKGYKLPGGFVVRAFIR